MLSKEELFDDKNVGKRFLYFLLFLIISTSIIFLVDHYIYLKKSKEQPKNDFRDFQKFSYPGFNKLIETLNSEKIEDISEDDIKDMNFLKNEIAYIYFKCLNKEKQDRLTELIKINDIGKRNWTTNEAMEFLSFSKKVESLATQDEIKLIKRFENILEHARELISLSEKIKHDNPK